MKKSLGKKIGVIFLLFIVFLCGSLSGILIQRLFNDQRQMESIAGRIGVDASWGNIKNYYYCTLLKFGAQRQEVIIGLNNIGYYHSYENFGNTLTIYFDDPIIADHLGNLSLAFNEKNILIQKSKLLGYDTANLPECK
jgi:hypothetical protein